MTRRCALALALVLMVTAPARVQADGTASIDTAAMQQELHRYFAGEKSTGWLAMGIGVPSMALGAGLATQPDGPWRGMAYPLLIFGAAEAAIGLGLRLRTGPQVARLDAQLALHPDLLRAQELRRMGRVNRNFHVLQALETTLLLTGASLAAVGGLQGRDTMTGVGAGLLVQSVAALLFDGLASPRADRYTAALERFRPWP